MEGKNLNRPFPPGTTPTAVMLKKKLKRKASTERLKYCHCNPFCNKKVTQHTRRRHYKRLRPEQLDEVEDSLTTSGNVSDYSSYSENFSSDALEAPIGPTSSSRAKSTKGSLLSDENIQYFTLPHQSNQTPMSPIESDWTLIRFRVVRAQSEPVRAQSKPSLSSVRVRVTYLESFL